MKNYESVLEMLLLLLPQGRVRSLLLLGISGAAVHKVSNQLLLKLMLCATLGGIVSCCDTTCAHKGATCVHRHGKATTNHVVRLYGERLASQRL